MTKNHAKLLLPERKYIQIKNIQSALLMFSIYNESLLSSNSIKYRGSKFVLLIIS